MFFASCCALTLWHPCPPISLSFHHLSQILWILLNPCRLILWHHRLRTSLSFHRLSLILSNHLPQTPISPRHHRHSPFVETYVMPPHSKNFRGSTESR